MSRRFLGLAGSVALTVATAGTALAQDTKPTTTVTTQTTKTIQHPDGSYTVIQYPADREVVVDLTPGATLTGAKGAARVMRSGDATTINLDLSGLPSDTTALNVYAVDPTNKVTLLGPVTVASGIAKQTFTTPLDKFMIVLSPEANLTNMATTTPVFFRSAVPQGLAVVPIAPEEERGRFAAEGEKVAAIAAPAYRTPLLGIASLPSNKETELKLQFGDAVSFVRGNIFITPNTDNSGKTRVKLKLHELAKVPNDAMLTLWAVNPEGQFMRLGMVTAAQGDPNVATIDTNDKDMNLAWRDFGLFITTENAATGVSPVGPLVGTITIR